MKKTIIIAVLAVFVGGGFYAKQKIEKDVVEQVNELFNSAAEYAVIKSEDIVFSLISKELTINSIEINGTEKLDNMFYSVDKITLSGFNTDSLLRSSGDYPLIADEILIENLTTTVPPALSVSVESYSIKGWKQNLALLLEAYLKGYQKEEFWNRAFTYYFTSVDVKNYRIEDKLAGTVSALVETSTSKPGEGKSFDFNIKNVTVDLPTESLTIKLDELSFDDLALPKPATMVKLIKWVEEVEANPYADPNLSEEDYEIFLNQNIKLLGFNISQPVFGESIEDVSIEELLSMKELAIATQTNPYEVSYEAKDLMIGNAAVNAMLGNPSSQEKPLSILLLDELLISSSVAFKLNETQDIIDYSHVASAKDLADFSYSANIKMPVPFEQILENQFAAITSVVNSANFKYEDKGFFPRANIYLQETENVTFEEIDTMAQEFFAVVKEGSPEYAPFIDAFLNMHAKPGTVEISLAKAMPILNLFDGSLEGIDVKYTPGSKTLKELVDSLQATEGK